MYSSHISLFCPLDLHKFSYNFATMSGLIQAMSLLKITFEKYAGKDGNKQSLTKAELSDLLRAELPQAGTSSKAEVDKFFSMLDNDKDGVVDFKEYVTFVAALTACIG
ncbi:ictacalcin-like [Thunnus albacares]|uniref:ictacalcin-like n=1 Tax=Thunnus albacares TaxID=8236 RepID=UPI001CF699E3|nr:ictacalcin-like [Thunnus albacares]